MFDDVVLSTADQGAMMGLSSVNVVAEFTIRPTSILVVEDSKVTVFRYCTSPLVMARSSYVFRLPEQYRDS